MKLPYEYLSQDQWRNWHQYLQHLPDVTSRVVIDFGCSTGTVCNLLAERFSAVIGLDQDEELLAVARARALPNVHLINSNIDGFELPDLGPIGGIWSSFTLAYLEKQEEFLSKIFELLEPSG